MSRPGAHLAVALAIVLVAACAAPVPSPSPATPSAAPAGSPSATGPAATPAATEPASEPASQAASEPYRDPTLPVEARVDDLLARMTDDEKIGQLTLIEKDSIDPQSAAGLTLGGILSGGDGNPTPNDPSAWYAMVDAYQQAALTTRLGIPILYGVDAIHGQSHVVGATIFPHEVGLGATHDADLVEQVGRATARETSATGIRWTFGPIVAVPQDVRWGRAYEAFGQDTASVSTLAEALIRGLQGRVLTSNDSVAATAKHFVGDGGTSWGTSDVPGYSIDRGLTDVDDATLRAVHLPPYAAAIDAGTRIVMASFSSTRAGKVHGDHHLLTDVLKGELGFTGFVVSDWGGVDEVVRGDYPAAVAQSLGAGIDMVMVPSDALGFRDAVRAGLADGRIAHDRLDDAVRRILRVKVEMGLFEHPMPAADPATVGSAANRQLAARAVAESAVLLRATKGALPIAPDGAGPVLLAGAAADDIGTQLGGWSITWQGSAGPTTTGTTLRGALADRLGPRLRYAAGGRFDGGAHARVGVVVVAEPPYAEGHGDSATLQLAPAELAVVDRVRPLVDKLVVVIYSGRPLLIDRLAKADALVAAWLPGTEGEGLAAVLLGDQPFAGTTPYTWPIAAADAPRAGKATCDGAVFPLGFGLATDGSLLGSRPCPGPIGPG
jgi:beta-glucosidase